MTSLRLFVLQPGNAPICNVHFPFWIVVRDSENEYLILGSWRELHSGVDVSFPNAYVELRMICLVMIVRAKRQQH